MKRFFAIIFSLLMMSSLLCFSTSAQAFSSDDVIRVYGLKADGSTIILDGFRSFEEGWEAAVDYAEDHDYMDENGYDRIVVDFLADWNANEKGEFGDSSGDGFQYSTIYVPSDTRITINLNGHTINRRLKEYEYDGEVISINDDADVIINGGKSGDPIIPPDEEPGAVKMGTITGGWSCNGAGGIHMQDGSRLTLNNVRIVANKVDDDNGAGIAVYDGAILTMNGGCVSHNVSYNAVYGGGVYVDEASAFFNDVVFQDNQGINRCTNGAAVYVDDGTLEMDGCKVIGNGLTKASNGDACSGAYSIIQLSNGSNLTMKDTRILENGYAQEVYVTHNTLKYTDVISSKSSYLTIEECIFADNNQVYLIESEASILNAVDSDFSGNHSFAFYGNCAVGFNSAFTNCKFSYNDPMLKLDDTFFFNNSNAGVSFIDCELGNATFHNKNAAKFVDTAPSNGLIVASMFSKGSLTLIVAVLALLASIASICLSIAINKGKAAAPTANNVDKVDKE